MTDLAERRGMETRVYGAAEDSHLLARAAVERVESGDLLLDVGTGSGYVAATVAETTGARVIGSDINPHACRRADEAGVEAVVQPGGSVNDEDVVAACDDLGLAMAFTGQRAFRHD